MEIKKKEYDVICKYAELGFEMSQPIELGVCNAGKNVYMILSWVEGEDMKEALPKCSVSEQYRLGRKAGEILKKIHSIEVPASEMPNESNITKKLRQIEKYIDSDVRAKNDEKILEFINENINKMRSLPPVYQHGDFHPGNLILTKSKEIGVIDFNRWRIGDPYEEFYKLESFGTEVSEIYCIAQIDEYFNQQSKPPPFRRRELLMFQWEIQAPTET